MKMSVYVYIHMHIKKRNIQFNAILNYVFASIQLFFFFINFTTSIFYLLVEYEQNIHFFQKFNNFKFKLKEIF